MPLLSDVAVKGLVANTSEAYAEELEPDPDAVLREP